MAHADYHCCALCDSKLGYGGIDSETKETICSDCLKALRSAGLSILDTQALIKWVETQQVSVVKETLSSIGFRFCHYLNPVDEAVRLKGIGKSSSRGILRDSK